MHFYNAWALRILRGEWTNHYAFYGLPGYPYLLAGIYKAFGYSPFLPGFLQACLEGGTAVILYRLAVKVFESEKEPLERAWWRKISRYRGEIVGLLAAAGWGLFQPAEAYSVILMPTAWLTFVFWFVVWQVVKRHETPRLLVLLLLGMILGFTAMATATVLFLIPLLLAALFFKWEMKKTPVWRARLAAALAVLFGGALGASPSWIHNTFIAQDSVFLSAHSGVNLWIGNNPWANGYPKFPPGLHAGQEAMLQDSITVAEAEARHSLKRSQVSAYWSSKAKNYIGHNPLSWLKLLAVKIGNFWNAFQYDDLSIITTLREEGVIFPGLGFGIVAALAIPGLFLGCWQFPLSRWVVGAIFFHMTSLLSVFVTERYRLAAVPGLLLFASYSVWHLWQMCVTANYRRCFVYLALLILSTWFVSIPKRDPSLWALDSYNTGLQALESNHLQAAEQKLDLAYAYVPDNAELNFALGNLRLAQGNKEAARSFYFSTLKLDPRHEGSYNNLGVLALGENRWNLAATFFAKALEQNPRDAKTYFLLANAHFKEGHFETARREIIQAIKLDPTRPEFAALKQQLEQKPIAP